MAPDCPLCKTPTRPEFGAAVRAHECDACHGHWISGPALMKFAENRARLPSAERLRREALAAPASRRPLACPDCKTLTFHTIVAAGIDIDLCDICGGIYLDAEEIDSLRSAGREGSSALAIAENVIDGAGSVIEIASLLLRIWH